MFAFIRILLLVFGSIHLGRSEETFTVTTDVGDIIGTIQPVNDDQTVTKFLGIPYAEAPIGDLRFSKPVKKARFVDPFNGTREGAACPQTRPGNQTLTKKSEDCLLLNIYVPGNMTRNSNLQQNKSVMIWTHGGRFLYEESNTYDGALLSVSGDVIIVTINYRLGILGFLSSGDAILPGNLGLWDQQLAIQWIHDHIDRFEGDPSSVTIFGHAASVIYQSFYPGNIGLFHRVIAQSGSITSSWAWNDKQVASQNFFNLGERFNCSGTNSDILDCLRGVPVNQLTGITQLPVPLTPVTDGEFVLDTAHSLLFRYDSHFENEDADAMFYSVDMVIGFTNADGLGEVDLALTLLNVSTDDEFVITKVDWENVLIPEYMKHVFRRNYSNYAQLLTMNEYTDWRDPLSDSFRIQQFVKYTTDIFFSVPTIHIASLHACCSARSTYMYEFSVRPITHVLPVPVSIDGDDVMNHADDVTFVFGIDIDQALADPAYSYLLNTYQATMTMWTNFAKSGNPNLPISVLDLINTTWPEYRFPTNKFINLTSNMSTESVKDNPRPRAVKHWTGVIHRLKEAAVPKNISRQNNTVRVITPVGEIIGTESYVPYSDNFGFRVQSYTGIPYAKPQTGNLRFQKPVRKEAFTEAFDATKPGPACYQILVSGFGPSRHMSEDCLILNVFVPKLGSTVVVNKAVMIWIHGGAFEVGESNSYDPQVLAGYGDVIVVTINYRVGQFGFLTTGDGVIPSNIGLWDQHMAIQWVYDNIKAFGGTRSVITIFGESAGASSVVHQAKYRGNDYLVRRAIAQSGSASSPWAISDMQRSMENTREFSVRSGCPLTSTRDFLECLQSKSIVDLERAMNEMTNPGNPLPVVDNDFILEPAKYIGGQSSEQVFREKDLMIGFNSADGLFLTTLFPIRRSIPINTESLSRSEYENYLVPLMFNWTNEDVTKEGLRAVIHEYTDWTEPESETKRAKQFVDVYTDYLIAAGSIETAEQHTGELGLGGRTFLYQFSVRPYVRLIPIPDRFDGPGVMNHGDDIPYVMGNFITDVTANDDLHQQLRVYLATITMWSNFAKYGDPNYPRDITKYLYTSWPEYTNVSKLYLDIQENVTNDAIKSNPRLRALNFWTNIFPEANKASTVETNQTSSEGGSCETSSAETNKRLSATFAMILVSVLLPYSIQDFYVFIEYI